MIIRFTYLLIPLTLLTFFDQTRFKKKDLLGQSKINFYDESIKLLPEAGKAFIAMREAALVEGIEIEIVSAYRSYERQKFIWNRKTKFKKIFNTRSYSCRLFCKDTNCS